MSRLAPSIMLQKLQLNTFFFIILIVPIGLVTPQKGDYIREKFGSVGEIYLEVRLYYV